MSNLEQRVKEITTIVNCEYCDVPTLHCAHPESTDGICHWQWKQTPTYRSTEYQWHNPILKDRIRIPTDQCPKGD